MPILSSRPLAPFSDVRLIDLKKFPDERGWFVETFHAAGHSSHGIAEKFFQDNLSRTEAAGTIRGLHFQAPPFVQAKLVHCLRGRIFDVVVDVRRKSPTFAKAGCVELDGEKPQQLLVPAGYAHGFQTLEPETYVAYKVDAEFAPTHERTLSWQDPNLRIPWPLPMSRISPKDAAASRLDQLEAL